MTTGNKLLLLVVTSLASSSLTLQIAKYKQTWAEFSSTDRRSPFLTYSASQTDGIKATTEPVDTKIHRLVLTEISLT